VLALYSTPAPPLALRAHQSRVFEWAWPELDVRPCARSAVTRGDDEADADRAMDRYSEGDEASFGVVHTALADRLRAFLIRMSKSPTVADDLLQETFLRIHRARGSFERGGRVVPWGYAIARNVYIDHTRSLIEKREKVTASDEAPGLDVSAGPETDGEQVSIATDLGRVVEATLAGLPRNQREAFVLLRYEGMSVADASEVLGASQGAVKLRAFHAYEALRAALGLEDRKRGKAT
jgi:RNA polymerase sigma-70 factor (ECF subfamily)